MAWSRTVARTRIIAKAMTWARAVIKARVMARSRARAVTKDSVIA